MERIWAMSWYKITLPLKSDGIDPEVVALGQLGWACYDKANRPAGYAMFHASRSTDGILSDKFLIYLSPVATEVCRSEIPHGYTLEPCEVPACDEPDIAFVLGDPLVMGHLQKKWQPEGSKAAESAT